MKKSVIFLLIISLLAAIFLCGCQKGEELNLYVPDGAPALAVANIIATKKIGNRTVKTTVTTGDNVSAKCQNGEADLAILPTNAAVTICSVRSDYLLFSINVHGLLYLVGTQQITSLSDLQGQTVHSIGRANTPEYLFKKILDVNSVDYNSASGIKLEYYTDAATIIPQVLQEKYTFAILGEPAVTNLINKAASQNKTVYRLLDLQQLWQQATNADSTGYPQASLIVKKSLLSDKSFAKALQKTVFVNQQYLQDNVATLNSLMKSVNSSLDVNYTQEILDKCNIYAEMAFQAKADLEQYLATFPALSKFLPLKDELFYEQSD